MTCGSIVIVFQSDRCWKDCGLHDQVHVQIESEDPSAVFFNLERVVQEGRGVVTALKRVMNKVQGEQARSRQETCHLIDSKPLVNCNYSIKQVNLRNDRGRVDLDDNGNGSETRPATLKTRIDLYGQFMARESETGP